MLNRLMMTNSGGSVEGNGTLTIGNMILNESTTATSIEYGYKAGFYGELTFNTETIGGMYFGVSDFYIHAANLHGFTSNVLYINIDVDGVIFGSLIATINNTDYVVAPTSKTKFQCVLQNNDLVDYFKSNVGKTVNINLTVEEA